MAINFNQQDQNNPQGQQNNQPNQPGQQSSKPRATGFTNIQRVLGANKDNKLGQTVGQGVQNLASKAQGQTQQAQQNFAKDIGSAVDDIKSGQKVQQNLSGIDFSKNSDEAANKLQEVGQDQYAQTAAKLRQGYQGPQGLQDQQLLQSQAQDLGQTAQGLMSQGGRQAALQRFMNVGPNYTQGKRTLDNMLLGQNNEAISQARKNAAQIAGQTNESITKAQQEAQATGQQYNALGQDITNKTRDITQNLTGTLDTRAQQKIQQAQTQVQGLKDRLAKGEITNEDYDYMVNNVLGGSSDIYNLTNEQLSGLFNANTDFNRSNVASQREIQARDALAKLAGAGSGDVLLDLDEAKAGTAGDVLLKNQQGLSAYQAATNAANKAQADFDLNTPYAGYKDVFNLQGQKVDYNKAKQILEGYSPYDRATNSFADPNFNMQNYINQLKSKGLGSTGYGGQERTAFEPAVQELYKQFNSTNKQYGIGNNLAKLLKDNKYGVK